MDSVLLVKVTKRTLLQQHKKTSDFNIILLITFGVFLGISATAFGQSDWTKYPGNPVLDVGSPGSWDAFAVCTSSVLYDGTIYRMWYFGYDSTNMRIGLATSSDGTTWIKHANNPVLNLGSPGTWDDTWVASPSVIFDGTIYKMWYSGYDGVIFRIGYAESSDGIQWTKSTMNPVLQQGGSGTWEEHSVAFPTVLFDGTTYQMWYHGLSLAKERIGYATSSDGFFWSKYENNPVIRNLLGLGFLENIHLAPRTVLFGSAIYQMWYRVLTDSAVHIDYATSPDGITWTKFQGSLVTDSGEPEPWDEFFVAAPVVLFDGTTYQMWYNGFDGKNLRIGYATASAVTSVEEPISANIPQNFALSQNHPNPFNPNTTITYGLPKATKVQIVIYNILGQKIRTLVDKVQAAGLYSLQWNGHNETGVPMVSGIYIYRIQTPEFTMTKKMLLLK